MVKCSSLLPVRNSFKVSFTFLQLHIKKDYRANSCNHNGSELIVVSTVPPRSQGLAVWCSNVRLQCLPWLTGCLESCSTTQLYVHNSTSVLILVQDWIHFCCQPPCTSAASYKLQVIKNLSLEELIISDFTAEHLLSKHYNTRSMQKMLGVSLERWCLHVIDRDWCLDVTML